MIAAMMASIKARKSARREGGIISRRDHTSGNDSVSPLVPEAYFRKVLSIERKRAERSERRFVLTLLHLGKHVPAEGRIVKLISHALSAATRETDLTGWYSNGSVVGILCTEIGTGELRSILSALHTKMSVVIANHLEPEQIKPMSVSFRVYPDDINLDQEGRPAEALRIPELQAVWPSKTPDYAVAGSPTV